MFDWPVHTHTSPTRMLVRVIVFSPWMRRVNGPPVRSGFSTTRQRPSFAMVVSFWFWNSTETCSPSLAVPQIGTFIHSCSTAPSEISRCGITSARASNPAHVDSTTHIMVHTFIVSPHRRQLSGNLLHTDHVVTGFGPERVKRRVGDRCGRSAE